jgi:hypothetical protein
MTVDFTSEQEAMLLSFAKRSGKTPADFLVDAVVLFAERDRVLAEGKDWISNHEAARRLGLASRS